MIGICLCGCGGETKQVKGKPNVYIKGHNSPWKGKKRGPIPNDQKQKMSASHLGRKYSMTEKGSSVLREKGKKNKSPEMIAKMKASLTGRKLTREHVRNAMRRRPITSLELAFKKIIDEYDLPYKFVGNGAFIIDGLNPDFINVNGDKIAIEVFSRFYKEIDGGSVEKYKSDRIKRLSPFGWKLYFFDETQVKPDYVLSTLEGGHSD